MRNIVPGLLAAGWRAGQAAGGADLVIHNARVFTGLEGRIGFERKK